MLFSTTTFLFVFLPITSGCQSGVLCVGRDPVSSGYACNDSGKLYSGDPVWEMQGEGKSTGSKGSGNRYYHIQHRYAGIF